MKNKVLVLILSIGPLLLCTSCESGNYLGRAVLGVCYGFADSYISNSGDQKMINNWNSIKSDIAPNSSYGTAAGNQLAQGDYTGAMISGLSIGAVVAGVDESIVAIGNSGVNNWLNGEKTAAMIDVTQIAAHVTGNYQYDQFLDFQREINQINRERRENLKRGMSIEDANKIRNERLAGVVVNITDYIKTIDAERKARVMARKGEIKNALNQRGYSDMEAEYLSSYISIEDVENDNTSWNSVDEMLDYHNIDYREPSDENVFFDDLNIKEPEEPTSNDEGSFTSVADGPKPVPTRIDPNVKEREDAVKLISRTILDQYALGSTDLSDDQKASLDQVADKMNQFKDINITIIGHTCNIGTLKANQNVGERRAKEDKYYLIMKGVSGLRIAEESRDYSNPVVENDNEEHRKQNRRVTFEVK